MPMKFTPFAALALVAASGATPTAWAALPEQPVGLPNGTYNCIASAGRMMLTLGQVTLTNGRYVFKTQNGAGPTTSGSYTLAADRKMTFSGDFGVIKHDNILQPHQEIYAVHAFAFEFHAPGAKLTTSAACKL